MAEDMVHHPKHYDGNTSLECIDTMELVLGKAETMAFCLGNAFKYLWRYKHKNGMQDLDKAQWYLARYATMSDESLEYDEKYQKMRDLVIKAKEQLTANEEAY